MNSASDDSGYRASSRDDAHGNRVVRQDLVARTARSLTGSVSPEDSVSPGDRVSAGHLIIGNSPSTRRDVEHSVFVDHGESFSSSSTTWCRVWMRYRCRYDPEKDAGNAGQSADARADSAGRELAGHRPLAELFQVILDLSVDACAPAEGS